MNLPRIENKNLHNEIHIWAADLDQWNLSCLEAVQELPETEAKKAGRFRFETHRKRYIKGHYLLRALLGMYLGTDFYDRAFHINKYGKPALINTKTEDTIFFNISNSENIYVCAFSQNSDIGIDIEKNHDLPDMDRIMAESFSAEEKRRFHTLSEPDRTRTFFQYWARKEALLKAMGMGLSYPMNQVNAVTGDKHSSQLITKIAGSDISNQWTLLDMDICTGFTSALALQGEHPDLAGQVRSFHLADEIINPLNEKHNNFLQCGAGN
ncbi:MAG: 4-phosphopantetheinyl transferase [Deltaproteobacteria bacterium]|nr:4-phosphopantetheinyl transferase [Deltaproteobacteria bacterium]